MTNHDVTTPMQRASMLKQALQQQVLMRVNGNRGGRVDRSTTAAPSDGVDDYLSQIVLGDPGTCSKATTTFILTDNSGSVCGAGGNDPTTRRHDEALFTIRHVAAACTCGRDRVALLPFDHPLGLVLPQRLTKHGIRLLKLGMGFAAANGASSDLLSALTFAEHLAKLTRNLAAIVVLSDFELTDPNPDHVLERMANFPGYVHAVVLGGDYLPRVLDEDERVTMSVIYPQSKPGKVAHAIFDGLTRYRKEVRA